MKLLLTRRGRIWALVLVVSVGAFAVFVLPPLRQPQQYHEFADQRKWLGVPNFLDVISNVGFLIVGLLGLRWLWRDGSAKGGGRFIEARERVPYVVFFLGIVFTCFGSAYYHLNPNDSTLVWDRLPMTISFMSILAAVISERISVAAGIWLLGPLVLLGVASVEYWHWRGNLWPYAAVQYFSLLLIGLIMLLFPPKYSRSSDLLWAVGFYALAKVTEALDAKVFATTRLVSGHTLKHFIAAFAAYWVLVMLSNRSAREAIPKPLM